MESIVSSQGSLIHSSLLLVEFMLHEETTIPDLRVEYVFLKAEMGAEESRANRLLFQGLPKGSLQAAKSYIKLSEKWLNQIIFQGLMLKAPYIVSDSGRVILRLSALPRANKTHLEAAAGYFQIDFNGELSGKCLLEDSQPHQCNRTHRVQKTKYLQSRFILGGGWIYNIGVGLAVISLMWMLRKYELLPYLKEKRTVAYSLCVGKRIDFHMLFINGIVLCGVCCGLGFCF